jgi:hypothetical protein
MFFFILNKDITIKRKKFIHKGRTLKRTSKTTYRKETQIKFC